ncbi:hypothetical protein M758_10G055200, partial [Ceratodon purpureus]
MESSNPHATLQKLNVASWLRAHGKFVRPELTRQQKQELKECFELIDADGSGAIDASELLTAFNVLGMHTKKAEVEAMLAEVDADGSGELMEAVMGGDKASQERLQARADAAEAERRAVRDEAANQIDTIKNIQQKAFTNIASQRIRKKAKLKKNEYSKVLKTSDGPLPHFVVEHMDPEVKNVLLDIHERAFQRRSIMQANRASKSDDMKEVLKSMTVDESKDSSQASTSHPESTDILANYKEEYKKLKEFQDRVKHKPVMEQQILHLKVLKSLHDYFNENKWE